MLWPGSNNKKMKKTLFLFFTLSTLQTAAQKKGKVLVDSLLSAIPAAKDDTIRARLYNRVFNEMTFINIDEAMQYARTGLRHAQKMKWPKGIAVFQSNLGRVYSDIGSYDSTLFYYSAALITHEKVADKYNMAATNINLGVAAQNIQADYSTAATYYFKALQLAEGINDSTLLSVCQTNIARIYGLQKNYTKALEFDNKALRIREKKGTIDEIANSSESIGKTYYTLNNIPKATEYLQKALTLYESSGNMMGLASVWSGLSLVYGNDYRKVAEARIKSMELWNEVNPMHPEAITNTGNLGVIYLDIVRYDSNHQVKYGGVIPDNKQMLLKKAEDNLNTAILLAGQSGNIDSKSYFTGVLAEVQEFKGDYKKAYYNFKAYREEQDSIFSQENKNKIAEAGSQREIDKKNSELTINKLALNNQRKTMGGLIGGLALLGIIGVLFYRQSQLRKKTNNILKQLNNELDNANKIKAKFFAIISHDLRAPVANLISFLNLQKNEPGLLSKETAAQHENKITTSAETLLENMEAMLLWSKGQMEGFKPAKNKIKASAVFEQLNKTFAAIDNVQISYHNPDDVTVITDGNYLQAIMHNLTSNAITALNNNPCAAIHWQAKNIDGMVVFSISDNGSGLPSEIIKGLNSETMSLGSKKGFGLMIVKDMVKAINSNITFESNASGTIFTITLPA
jgi:signal transduction histidine kinase/tetratricopeptide (TPR) repeat protein